MNVIFLTINSSFKLNDRGIYQDLLRHFRNQGHTVFIAKIGTADESDVENVDGATVLNVRTPSLKNANLIKKGIATLLVEYNFTRALKKHFSHVNFDLILYGTPPITYVRSIKLLKKKSPNALSYLLLKDIYPQNAVDMGMFSSKGLIHAYFRQKEKALYKVSDKIGCMSPANVTYLLKHNPELNKQDVEVAPNSVELTTSNRIESQKAVREHFKLPTDRPILIYGGNLGVPQGIDFLIKCLENNGGRNDCFFLIVGDGTEYAKLKRWFDEQKPTNARLIKRLPKEEYDRLVQSCDIGLIFLDHRFTLPNYPSRLLSYLEYSMPIIAATDPNTDIGKNAEENNYGLWCESNDVDAFTDCVNKLVSSTEKMREMGANGKAFLEKNYLVEHTYQSIIKHIQKVQYVQTFF